MSEEWKYQLRIILSDESAEAARRDPDDPVLRPLTDILKRHDAALKCQYDAFAGYVAEAEKNGVDAYPLYAWTKATIEDPVKEAKYTRSFALYVGGNEVYAGNLADALEADIRPLAGGSVVRAISKHDTNPANNPQPPERYRKPG